MCVRIMALHGIGCLRQDIYLANDVLSAGCICGTCNKHKT